MSGSRGDAAREARSRAGDRCEYCRMHQSLQGAVFHIDHVSPRSAGGTDEPENLCLACASCNLHKSNRVAAPHPGGETLVPLFNPRTQRWADHFRWDGLKIDGLTPTGLATIEALQLNSERRMFIRQAESLFGLFPPED